MILSMMKNIISYTNTPEKNLSFVLLLDMALFSVK